MQIPFIFSSPAALTILAAFKATTAKDFLKQNEYATEVSFQGILVVTEQIQKDKKIIKFYVPNLIVTPITVREDFVKEEPLSAILKKMKTCSILSEFINDNNTIKESETIVKGTIVETVQYYYLQIHTHPYMPQYGVVPSAVDIEGRNQLAQYTPKVCTMILNETVLGMSDKLFSNSLFTESSLKPLAELEANLWFNNNDICCGQVKEAKISLGIEGTFHLYDTNEVIFIEGEDEDPNAITSINANRLSHFIIDNIVRTPEEILLDEELYDTFVRNKHSLVEVGVFLLDTKVGEEEDWEDFINTIKIESNLSFIPLKSTAIGTPEIVKIDNKKFIKGNSLVDFYLESCNEQEFKEYLNQKSFYYLEPIDTFKDLIFAIKKLIKVEEKPKPILLNPLHKAKPKNPYYDEYR